MKKNEIVVGKKYRAKVSGKLTTVEVKEIGVSRGVKRDTTVYECVNLTTGRTVIFRSAAKFRSEVK